MEFPRDRPLLRIGELSRRLGVSDHVLRAWENRYGLLQPVRSPGGFRLNSEADERRIRRMQAYLADGLSAAEAARTTLSGDASTPPGRPAGPPLAASAGNGLSAALRQALDAFDEPAAQAVLDRLLADLSVPAVLRDVVLPYLAELGERWQRGTASVAMEHFASNGPQALLACPPALREEENRPAPPSQQVIASPVTGPTPYSRSASTLAPVRLRAAASSRRRSTPRRASSPASMSKAVATCSCPAGDRCAAAAARSACRSRSVRSAPSPSAGARPDGRTPRECAAPRRCARPAGRDRSPAAPGTPGCATAGPSSRAAGPRPAIPADAASRSCRSWRAACGPGRTRYPPARRRAPRRRPRPAPPRRTASRCTPPARTRRRPGRRTAPARTAGAPGRPGRSGRASPPLCRCPDSRR